MERRKLQSRSNSSITYRILLISIIHEHLCTGHERRTPASPGDSVRVFGPNARFPRSLSRFAPVLGFPFTAGWMNEKIREDRRKEREGERARDRQREKSPLSRTPFFNPWRLSTGRPGGTWTVSPFQLFRVPPFSGLSSPWLGGSRFYPLRDRSKGCFK